MVVGTVVVRLKNVTMTTPRATTTVTASNLHFLREFWAKIYGCGAPGDTARFCIKPEIRRCVACRVEEVHGKSGIVVVIFFYSKPVPSCRSSLPHACLTSYCNQNSNIENAIVFGVRRSKDAPNGNPFQFVCVAARRLSCWFHACLQSRRICVRRARLWSVHSTAQQCHARRHFD